MSKKIFSLLTIFALLFTIVVFANAKDITLSSLSDEQSVSVLATISDITDSHITLEIYNQIGTGSKEKLPETIKLDKFKYTYCSEHAEDYNVAKIGDNVFISLESSGTGYKFSGVAYKTDTVDIRTLNILLPVDMENEDCMAELVAEAYYIRSNGTQKEFAIESDGSLYAKKDGQEIKLYPADSKTQLPIKLINSDGKTASYEKSHDVLAINTNDPFDFFEPIDRDLIFGRRIVALGIIFAGLIIGMIIIYFSENKRKKS